MNDSDQANSVLDRNKQQLQCFVSLGLSNRINGLVSAYLIKPQFKLFWAVNNHCPVSFEDLFHPLTGVHCRNVVASSFRYRVDTQLLSWFYLCNPGKIPLPQFVPKAKEGYRYLLSRLKHRPDFELPLATVGVCVRSLTPASSEPLSEFLPKLDVWLRQRQPRCVFIASDSLPIKNQLVEHIQSLGLATATVECRLLTSDMQRSPENIFGMSKELVCLSQCRLGVISNSGRSSIPDSSRGFDIRTTKTFDPPIFHRDRSIENAMDESSLCN